MLYLAKVQKNDATDDILLMLLACQTSESLWSLASPSDSGGDLLAVTDIAGCPSEGFVLAEVSEGGQIESVQDATPWVLTVIEQYVTKGITPEALMAEAEQAEEWRQSLTMKSQDVVRRSVEVETRRDQIQELERGLEEKREKLDAKREELESLQDALAQSQQKLDDSKVSLSQEQQRLDMTHQALAQQQQDWHRKLERLQQELEGLAAQKRKLTSDIQDVQNVIEVKS